MSHSIASKSLLLLLGGAAIGATAALLYAPMSGRDTRRKLKQVSGDWAHRAALVAPAIRRAAVAGKEAFVLALNGSAMKPQTIPVQRH